MTEIACPICETVVPGEGENFPFCSMRCKQVDLGNWFNGAYRIAGADEEPEQDDPESYAGRPVLPPQEPDGLDED